MKSTIVRKALASVLIVGASVGLVSCGNGADYETSTPDGKKMSRKEVTLVENFMSTYYDNRSKGDSIYNAKEAQDMSCVKYKWDDFVYLGKRVKSTYDYDIKAVSKGNHGNDTSYRVRYDLTRHYPDGNSVTAHDALMRIDDQLGKACLSYLLEEDNAVSGM